DAVASNGKKVRISSRYSNFSLDLAVDSSELCSYTNNLFIDGEYSQHSFGYALYQFWKMSYQIIAGTILPDLDRVWHGVVPTGVTAVTSPIARVADSNHIKSPAQCANVEHVRVCYDEEDPENDKLPVYVLRPLGVEHKRPVTVSPDGGVPVTPTPVGSSSTLNAANFSDGSGTVTWTTDLALTTDYSAFLPSGDPMYIAGGLAINGMRSPINPLVI